MRKLWEVVRSVCLWVMSWLHFLIVVPILIALAIVLDPRTRLAAARVVQADCVLFRGEGCCGEVAGIR
jgi:hypothetical protein